MLSIRLLLASTSPRRRELLTRAGITHRLVEPGHEPVGVAADPALLAAERAASKARGARWSVAFDAYPGEVGEPVVLGVDTVVACDGFEFGKAADREAAQRSLRALSGREHRVHTAIHLFLPWRAAPGDGVARIDTAVVRFDPLDEERLGAYLDSGAWQGKAGAYGIQDPEQDFVHLVDGDLETVIGLATRSVRELLEALGFGGASSR